MRIGHKMDDLELKVYLSEILEKFEKYATAPRNTPCKLQRNFEIFKLRSELYNNRLTFKEIAQEFDISKVRARQVFEKFDRMFRNFIRIIK
jgi:DNA-directed RNA polymerase sigma subunit (sigma70/sigma32)